MAKIKQRKMENQEIVKKNRICYMYLNNFQFNIALCKHSVKFKSTCGTDYYLNEINN